MKYSTIILAGKYNPVKASTNDGYARRQVDANELRVMGYFEQHVNAVEDPGPNYAMAIVADNYSERSYNWARRYAEICAAEFCGGRKYGEEGVRIGGRGNDNLRLTHMPAILGEPGFASNPRFRDLILTAEGQERAAMCLVRSIEATFPLGGTIALSIGHGNKEKDQGCAVGDRSEMEINTLIVIQAAKLLNGLDSRQCPQCGGTGRIS